MGAATARPLTRPLRLLSGAICALAAAALAGPVAGASAAADPIAGTWNYQGGRVLVEATGPGSFAGTVTSATRFLACAHPVGEPMWSITRAGDGYSGTHQWFTEGDCLPAPGGRATWRLRESGDRFLLDFCTAPPGQGEPGSTNAATICNTLDRAKPPTAPPVQVCLLAACLEGSTDTQTIGCVRRGSFTHRFAVKLRGRRARGMRVRVVVFRLDGRRIGSRRRRPFVARVRGRALTPGPHRLVAKVHLVSKRRSRTGRRRTARMQLKYSFRACDQ